MSLFGEPLPFEDETAASLIRRTGYPPEGTYNQMPEVYLCPCCSEFNKQQERERLLREARDAKEAERRRLMQLDVFDERARPLPSGDSRRKAYRRIVEDEEPVDTAPSVPPPPPTLDELRRAKRDQNVPKLVVTVHHGRNISAEAEDPVSVIVRCGAFEGQTAKVPRGTEVLTPWEELFEFPYMNPNEPLEVLVVNDALPQSNDQLVGGVVIPSGDLHDRERGDQEPVPVMPEESMHNGYGTCKEGPLGTIVASWYVRDGDEKMDETAMEKQTLATPLACTFVAHRLFQYTDHGAEPYSGGVLCVLRDTDDNCSESVLYTPGPNAEPSLSPYHTKEGYHYLPENPSQMMQLNTEKKLGHILVCVPKQEEAAGDEEEELLVIGAVPLDFERLYNKGSAVLLIESKSKDDALWGEISIEWANTPLDEEKPHPALLEVQKESLFVTVVRGLNLVRADGEPVENGYITVAAGELEGATVEAPAVEDEDDNHVINWNQEVRFIEVDPTQRELEVQAFEKERLISVGTCTLSPDDEGVVIIQMHRADDQNEGAGEIVVSYKRLHAPRAGEEGDALARAADLAHDKGGHDEEDEEDQEREEVAREGGYGASDADHHADEEDEENDEQKEGRAEAEEPAPADVEPVVEHPMVIDREDHAEDEEREDDERMQEDEHAEDGEREDDERAQEDEEDQGEDNADHDDREDDGEEGNDADHDDHEHDGEEGNDADNADHDDREDDGEEGNDADNADHDDREDDGEEGNDADNADHDDREDDGEEGSDADHADNDDHERDDEEGSDADHADHDDHDDHDDHEHDGEQGSDADHADHDDHEHDGEEDTDANRDVGDQGAAEDEDEGDGEGEEPAAGEGGDDGEDRDAQHGENEEDEGAEATHDDDKGEEGAAGEPRVGQHEGEPGNEEEAAEEDQPDYAVPAPHQKQRRVSWKPTTSPTAPGYNKPWYPSGNPQSEQHLPFDQTNLSKKNLESIRELEKRKSLIEEESVRRGSTPRRSSTRGVSPNSQ